MVKSIFQRKALGFIFLILLFAACVYPPFHLMTESGITMGRKWDWIFTLLPTPSEVPEIDLEMLLVEVIMAIPLAIAISLIFHSIKTALRRMDDRRLKGHYFNRKL